ncbi:hypothetical protein QBC38DRAFT_65461 [Podospora fimiseda]|uniref:Pathway-specific nitrogen regulator n=1 Tax=Podospora fimiseda TaxID=252190 RepID=A0AAN6YPB5_9PEZI|nr:hypothetical protein QBC38DRAFT_65461 [Podospora fimiseda]
MPRKLPKVDTNFTIFVDPSCRSPIEESSKAQRPVLNKMAQVPSPDINPAFEAPDAQKQPRLDGYPTLANDNMSHHEQELHPHHQMHSRNSSENTVQQDDDVFSDNGDRSNSSLGSVDGGRDDIQQENKAGRLLSNVSGISNFMHYDKEFVPIHRVTRQPFRTPSEIKAIQMLSPTASTFDASMSRLAKRQAANSTSPFPTVSRVGSPNAQYSPKGRSTPIRFKQKEAPLVLLHVTVLPLRWMWGDVLNGLDAVNGKALDDNGLPFIASEQLKTLRDSWRELQDRVNDNILERGILLPHPQNDFEVLEERVLEALELPVKRRARILECGHYLGPSNITSDLEDDSDDDSSTTSSVNEDHKKHWCTDCKSEIRFEHLGSKRVFRVKVFASNGLLKAGAWDACWNQMERVDVEVEPIVDSTLRSELEKLGAIELDFEEQRQQEATKEAEPEPVTLPTRKRAFTADHGPFMERPKSQQSRHFQMTIEEPSGISSRPGTARPATARPASVLETRRPMSSPKPVPVTPDHFNSSPSILHPPEILSPSRPRAHSRLHVELRTQSEERRVREEERLQGIYEDQISTEACDTTGSELDSSALAIITSMPSRSGSFHTANSTMHGMFDNQKEHRWFTREEPSFVDLLTETFRVGLNNAYTAFKDLRATLKAFGEEPRNVAIVILILLVLVISLGGRDKQDMAPAVYRHESTAAEHTASLPRVPVIDSALEPEVDVLATESVDSPAFVATELASGETHSGASKLTEAEKVRDSKAQQVLNPDLKTASRVDEQTMSPADLTTATPTAEGEAQSGLYWATYAPAIDAVNVYAPGRTCETGIEKQYAPTIRTVPYDVDHVVVGSETAIPAVKKKQPYEGPEPKS